MRHDIPSRHRSRLLSGWLPRRTGRYNHNGDVPGTRVCLVEPLESRWLLSADIQTGLGGNEPAVTIHPTNPNVVAVAQFRTISISRDGGATFPAALQVAVPTLAGYAGGGGDPSMAFDSQGRLFFSYLASQQAPVNPNFTLALFAARIDNVAAGTPAVAQNQQIAAETNTNQHDKEWIAVDSNPSSPFRDSVYVVWSQLGNNQILFSRSINGGANWSGTSPISGAAVAGANAGSGFMWPSHTAVAPNGDLYVGWHNNTCGAANATMTVLRDSNGGADLANADGGALNPVQSSSFQAAVTCNVQDASGDEVTLVNAWMQGALQLFLLPDPLRPGNIYAVANDDPNNNFGNGDDGDVILASSTDNGNNWTLSTISHAPAGTLQAFPTAGIDELGNIAVSWYDTRRGLIGPGEDQIAGNTDDTLLMDVYHTVSRDGGLTFSVDFRVNDQAFDPTADAPCRFGPQAACGTVTPGTGRTLRIGEYNGVASSNGIVYTTWTGNGADTNGNAIPNQDIFLDKFSMLGVFADRLETNDSLSTATVLGSLPKVTLQDLSLHHTNDVDVFKYTAQDNGKLLLSLFFDHANPNVNAGAADLDLTVQDVNGNVIATGAQSIVLPSLAVEQITVPVVSQEEYFITVNSTVDIVENPVVYDLEIENFAAPVTSQVFLDPADDTGMIDNDNVTSEDEPRVLIQADLSDFAAMGITILSAAQAGAAQMAGAAVEVFRNGVTQGFADVIAASGNTLFGFQFDPGDLVQGVNLVAAAVRIFDGQQDAGGNPQPAQGRSQLGEPLLLRLDTVAPSTPAAPDLLAASDTGMNDDDNVTNKMQPAFSGTTERNAKVRVKADGVVVGQGLATSSGNWEVTVEPLDDDTYDITLEVEDLAGNVSSTSLATQIEIDTLVPNTPFLDLVEADDSGRHNDDNITNVNTPLLSATTHDPNAGDHIQADNFKYRIYDRLEETVETLLYDSFAQIGFTNLNQIFTTANVLAGATIVGPLADGIHNLKLEVEDRAGNISHDFLLDVLIDTVAPDGTADLHPDSDTGIWGFVETMDDLITNDKTPKLFGATEANALVRADIDDVPAGTAVAVPLDGDDAFPPPPEFDGNYMLDTILNLDDGVHTIEVFFRDVAGNETAAADASTFDILLDSEGPRITNVTDGRVSTDGDVSVVDGVTSLFEPKPAGGPDPLIHSIVVHFIDGPDRSAPDFLVPALFEQLAEEEGNYRLTGDANGEMAIIDVNPVFTTVDGQPAVAEVELVFQDLGADQTPFTNDDGLGGPLPDDRYTLWVSDSISDPAGNPLDGESGALAPFEGNDVPNDTPPIFPTGDGAHGGDFHARFTVDSRPEIATYLGDGTWYVDLNGNGIFDQDNVDPTNRDIVWKFGTKDDLPVTGDWNGDGYDEIGVLGKRGGKDFFFLDLDGNGAFDPAVDASFEVKMQGAGNGLPIAGDWDGDGSDEVAVLQGNSWFIDDTGTAYNPALSLINPTKISTSMRGLPIAGDWDGDGDDNVGTYENDQFFLDTDDNFGASDLTVNFPEFDFGGLKPQPVAHDWDQDGDDDIGLFVRRETGNNSGAREAGEWFLDVNTDLSGTGIVNALFEPPPTGLPGVPLVNQDMFYNFGDEREPAALNGLVPVVGNFDPPVGVSGSGNFLPLYTNSHNHLDVNSDGLVTPGDALVVINKLNDSGAGELPFPARPTNYVDVSGDGYLAPQDVLMIVNALNQQASLRAEGESPIAIQVVVLPELGGSEGTIERNEKLFPAELNVGIIVVPSASEQDSAHDRRDLVIADEMDDDLELEELFSQIAEDVAKVGL